MRARHRRIRLVTYFSAVVLLVAASCSDSGGDPASDHESDATDAVESDALEEQPKGVLQRLWIIDRVEAIDLDGELIDIGGSLLEMVTESAGDPVELSSKVSFARSTGFGTVMVDDQGEVVESVNVVGGVVENVDGDRGVAIVATPQLGEQIFDRNLSLRLDLPPSLELVHATPIVLSYGYAQIYPVEGALSLEDGLDPLQLLAARTDIGTVAYFADDAGTSQIVTGEIGVVRATDDGTTHAPTDSGEQQGSSGPWVRLVSNGGDSDSSSGYDDYREYLEKRRAAGRETKEAIDEALDIVVGDKSLGDAAKERAAGAARDKAVEKATDALGDAMEVPADSRPLIDAIGEGLLGCEGGISCVEDVTDKVAQGFEESLGNTLGGIGGGGESSGDSGGGSGSGDGSTGSGGGSGSGDGSTGSGGVGGDGDGSAEGGAGDDGGAIGPTFGNPGALLPGGGGDQGSSSGDPHILTFDNVQYELQVPGEFVAARSDGLEIQVRYEPVACSCPATVTSAVAVGDGAHRVFVSHANGRVVTVDGDPVDLEEESSTRAGDLTVQRVNSGLEIVDGDGNVVHVHRSSTFLDVVVSPADDRVWKGLLGNHNDNPDDDFQTADGEDLGPEPDTDLVFGEFADSWRITNEESLFEYEVGQTTETFTNTPFPVAAAGTTPEDQLARQAARLQQAETLCRLGGITDPTTLANCTMDFQVTGNVTFVRSSRFVDDRVIGPDSAGGGSIIADASSIEEFPSIPLATGDGLVLVRMRDPAGRVLLHAVDIDRREIRWSVPDISPRCRPVVVEGVGVVAQVQQESALLGDDPFALVLLSLDDGTELSRFVGKAGQLEVCDAVMTASDDVVFHLGGDSGVRAFRVAETITPLWERRYAGALAPQAPITDGHLIVASFVDPGGVLLEALDVETGEIASSIAIEGQTPRTRSPGSIEIVGDGLVAVATGGNTRTIPAALTVVDASDGSLREVWSRSFGSHDPENVPQVVRLGDLVVGWRNRPAADGLIAYALEDGELAWTYEATGTDTPQGLIVSVAGEIAVLSPYPGAWLELVDANGSTVDLLDPPPSYANAQQLTVVADRIVVVTGVIQDGGLYIDFVDV